MASRSDQRDLGEVEQLEGVPGVKKLDCQRKMSVKLVHVMSFLILSGSVVGVILWLDHSFAVDFLYSYL